MVLEIAVVVDVVEVMTVVVTVTVLELELELDFDEVERLAEALLVELMKALVLPIVSLDKLEGATACGLLNACFGSQAAFRALKRA